MFQLGPAALWHVGSLPSLSLSLPLSLSLSVVQATKITETVSSVKTMFRVWQTQAWTEVRTHTSNGYSFFSMLFIARKKRRLNKTNHIVNDKCSNPLTMLTDDHEQLKGGVKNLNQAWSLTRKLKVLEWVFHLPKARNAVVYIGR